MGGSAGNSGGVSPPPPAPPPRDASIASVNDGDNDSLEGTLRGPNKPLPPTPTGGSPPSDASNQDTLPQQKRNKDVALRPSMVKAASMPDVRIVFLLFSFGFAGEDCSVVRKNLKVGKLSSLSATSRVKS
ncbi:hypothetical protein OESDEN_01210 [Oesophagostomum dentatum]|uniref:Uncharacterized protein n=1 Tax=Oesophagostomum dentatum TaxID=61180 RepID=A0A0B1TNG8_OESDE|nr:hypothetical protein OESDEN_01210 [Oesophagostomum dentatum]